MEIILYPSLTHLAADRMPSWRAAHSLKVQGSLCFYPSWIWWRWCTDSWSSPVGTRRQLLEEACSFGAGFLWCLILCPPENLLQDGIFIWRKGNRGGRAGHLKLEEFFLLGILAFLWFWVYLYIWAWRAALALLTLQIQMCLSGRENEMKSSARFLSKIWKQK